MTKLIAKFLGYDFTDEEIEEILAQRPNQVKEDNDQSKTIQKSRFQGIIGDWQNYFSPEQSRTMDELYKKRLGDTQLSLVFDSVDAMKRFQQYGRIICVGNESKNIDDHELSIREKQSIHQKMPHLHKVKPELTRD